VGSRVHICSFEAVDIQRGDLTDYERFRHKVLLAGRFSVFEATESQRKAGMYTRLCRDPEVIIEKAGFPWTVVRPAPNPIAHQPPHKGHNNNDI
jgi:uncharacterized protein YbjT (DUF2867 family)